MKLCCWCLKYSYVGIRDVHGGAAAAAAAAVAAPPPPWRPRQIF